MRWSARIRVRLTVLYACAFFLTSALLLAVVFVYVEQSLDSRPGAGAQAMFRQFLGAEGIGDRPIIDRLLTAVTERAEQQRRDSVRAIGIWSLVSLAAVSVVAAATGWLLAGRVLKPLQQITATARRVVDTNLGERIALTGPVDEIKDLADTFDAMLERLDRSFDGQRRFVANASHELRTPLTINRTLIEVALNEPDVIESMRHLGTTLLAVNERHERLIDGLLMLTRSHQLMARTPVNMADVVDRSAAALQSAADRSDVTIRTDCDISEVVGDPILLEQLTHNLIDNAIKYNVPHGGWVAVTAHRRDRTVELTVENSGPEVLQENVRGLFQPFRRSPVHERIDSSRGAGLGLSIVESVAAAHAGSVDAVARPGGGLTITVRLQAAG